VTRAGKMDADAVGERTARIIGRADEPSGRGVHR